MVVGQRRNSRWLAAAGMGPKCCGRDESSTASTNAWQFATLDQPPNRRTCHPERAARFFDGHQFNGHNATDRTTTVSLSQFRRHLALAAAAPARSVLSGRGGKFAERRPRVFGAFCRLSITQGQEVVTLTFASWSPIREWLRQLNRLRPAKTLLSLDATDERSAVRRLDRYRLSKKSLFMIRRALGKNIRLIAPMAAPTHS